MTNTALDDLSRLILSQQDGLVKDPVQMRTIINALEQAWPFISGSDRESTTANKLYRAESVSVKKPCINFTLERHGGTVNGSSRAHLHHWEINVTLMTASIVRIGHRQLEAMSPRMDVKQKALDVFELVKNCERDPRIEWVDGFSSLKVNIAIVVPDNGIQQTTTSRRKRFRNHLTELLSELGWQCVRHNRYEKTCQEQP